MTQMILVAGLTIAIGLGAAAPASAWWGHPRGTASPRIDGQEANQHARIHAGVQSGRLTSFEAARLNHRLGNIQRKEALFKSDGVLTPRERFNLHASLNRSSRAIWRQGHDAQTVWHPWHPGGGWW